MKRRNQCTTEISWTINNETLPVVKNAVHLRIIRSVSLEQSVKETVTENSLLSMGMHGENGLDPASCVHLMKTYVLPVLTYGPEVLLPC